MALYKMSVMALFPLYALYSASRPFCEDFTGKKT